MADCELLALLDNDQMTDYFMEMEKHHSARVIEYNKMSNWIIKKLKSQNKFLKKITNAIKHKYRVNRVLGHIKSICANTDDVEKIISDYTMQNVMILYIHIKSPWIKGEIKYYIESYNLCNKALLNPYEKYPEEFIENMIDKTPTYYWECRLQMALRSIDIPCPNTRTITLKKYKADCMSYIKFSIEYEAFINALKTEKALIKKLIMLFIKIRNEVLKR